MTTPEPSWRARIEAALHEDIVGGELDEGGTVWYASDPRLMAERIEQALGLDRWVQNQNLLAVQGMSGNWDYDPYMHGMFNGMELIMSTVEGREPQFREAPATWRRDTAPGFDGVPPELLLPVSPEEDERA